MIAEDLDKVNSVIDADTRAFISVTAVKLGALEDRNPDQFPGLRDAGSRVKETLIQWRRGYRNTAKAGYPDAAAKALIDSGGKLHAALVAFGREVRRASPSRLGAAVSDVLEVVGGVSADIGAGLQAVGKATLEAGKESLVIVKYLPWLAVGALVLYVVGPRLFAAGLQGYRSRREQPA